MPTRKQEKAEMLKEVEVGLERYAYGFRYLDNITEVDQTNKPLFLRKPEEFKFQPQQINSPAKEHVLQAVKAAVILDYDKALGKKQHHTTLKTIDQQQKIVKELRARDDIVIKVADKDKQFVISDKTVYIKKVEEMLSDTRTYKQLPKNPLPRMNTDIYIWFDNFTYTKISLDRRTL